MNCKQGDLAIVVRTLPEYQQFIGKIVTCVGLVNSTEPAWETDPPIVHKGKTLVAEDRALKPLRGDLLNDEITTLKELKAV